MFTTWHTMLFLTVSTSLVPMMRWAVVLDCLLLIGSFSNLLINFLVNYCSPSTSHRTPLRSETGPTLHTHAGGITRQSSSRRPHGDPPATSSVLPETISDTTTTTISGGGVSSCPPPPHGSSAVTCYRFGSVGQDTIICLWDLTEEVLKKSSAGFRRSHASNMSHSNSVTSKVNKLIN